MIPEVSSACSPVAYSPSGGDRARPVGGLSRLLAAVACCAVALIIGAAGCAGGKTEIEQVTLAFVNAIKNQDSAKLETIIDWERYYSYREDGDAESNKVKPEDVETQKTLLLKVLSRDRGLALRYLTADSSIRNISIDGEEARAEVLQVDRATGEERLVTLLLAKNGVWKIYRFSTKELDNN